MNKYDSISEKEILRNWDSIDKEELLRSKAILSSVILNKLFEDETVDNSLVWAFRFVDQEHIERYATTENDWRFICKKYKMTPEFMTDHKELLQLEYIPYQHYTVDELIKTEGILFPKAKLKCFGADDLIRLFRAQKITSCPKGGVEILFQSRWGQYKDWTNGASPLRNAMCLTNRQFGFSILKPFIIESGLSYYDGEQRLTYDNLIELYSERPDMFRRVTLDTLLQRKKLRITNEEWDALIALIELGR